MKTCPSISWYQDDVKSDLRRCEGAAALATLARLVPDNGDSDRDSLLVVDDDPRVIDLVRQLLEEEPYKVEAASDGQEALTAIARQRPDIILLDLLMPRLDGFGVIDLSMPKQFSFVGS